MSEKEGSTKQLITDRAVLSRDWILVAWCILRCWGWERFTGRRERFLCQHLPIADGRPAGAP